jgi:plastocyanin
MAKRLKTRLSAGAALVTGLGMMGLATAVPAQAATPLTYTCTMTDGQSHDFVFTLDSGAETAATVGDTVTFTPTGTVALDADFRDGLVDGNVKAVDGELPAVGITVGNGTQTAPAPMDISIARTPITATTTTLPLSGAERTVDASAAGTYTISAPDSFNATLKGYDGTDASSTQVGANVVVNCAYKSGSKVIDTIIVADAPVAPVTDDWFDEPSSLPLVDNVFTVAGDATHGGTLTVQVLGGAKDADGGSIAGDVLKSYTMSATEGANSADFNLVEGADYVRLLSQDCVDAAGNTSSVAGGCNVTYTAPWAADGDSTGGGEPVVGTPTDEDTGTDAGTDDDGAAAGPQRPSVVQTDGLTPVREPAGNDTATFLLGGALLAGVGAGSVVLVRRRQNAQR